MAAQPSAEIDILVEDEVARTILMACIPSASRSRLALHVIGSATALARQLAALHVRGGGKPTLAIFDGDQRAKEPDNLEHAKNMCETPKPDFANWFASRIDYLPGDSWPEAWLVQRSADCVAPLAAMLSCEPEALNDILEYGLQAGKHNEFLEIAKHLGMDRDMCLQMFAMVVCNSCTEEFKPLLARVAASLQDAG